MAKSWTALGVPERIVAGLLKRGIAEPFPVQAATFPESLMGLDFCGMAPTG
jgi:superfamily II DNA/RNA helicase